MPDVSTYETQRLTVADLRSSLIRIPVGPVNDLLPEEVCDLDVDLRGERTSVRFRPNDGKRSARLRFRGRFLEGRVRAAERLSSTLTVFGAFWPHGCSAIRLGAV